MSPWRGQVPLRFVIHQILDGGLVGDPSHTYFYGVTLAVRVVLRGGSVCGPGMWGFRFLVAREAAHSNSSLILYESATKQSQSVNPVEYGCHESMGHLTGSMLCIR